MFSLWHCRRFVFLRCVRHKSTFLRSLRSTSVTRLPRYYGRSDSCSPGSSAYTRFRALLHELQHLHEQVSPIYACGLPTFPSPIIRRLLSQLFHATPQLDTFPLCVRGPGFAFGMQAHQLSPDRIEFVILRTCRSPPAAPHPALRRRSCYWLRAGERLPGGDFHPSDHRAFRAHIPPTQLVDCSYPAYTERWSGLGSIGISVPGERGCRVGLSFGPRVR